MAQSKEQKAAAKAAKAQEKTASKADVSSVTVTWNAGSRDFSKEVHGEDFQDLAKQFAEKFKGTIA